MISETKLHKNQSGQAALETAIILIAFVVVASVFAFAILSAGSASTEKGEQAIYAGLSNVQSSMEIKGAVIAEKDATAATVASVVFTVSPVSGGEPVNLADSSGTPVVVIAYRDNSQAIASVPFTTNWIVFNEDTTADDLLEEGELAEIVVNLAGLTPALGTNTPFTLEIKPPTGAVLGVNRTTPAALEAVMELR